MPIDPGGHRWTSGLLGITIGLRCEKILPFYEPEERKLKGTVADVEGMKDGAGLRLWRMGWLLLLVGQAIGATACWWLAPSGFGIGHPRTWLNNLAMPAIVLGVVATLWVLRRRQPRPLRWVLAAWASMWVGAIVTLSAIFPVTMGGIRLLPVAVVVNAALIASPSAWTASQTRTRPLRWLLRAWPTTWATAAVLLAGLGMVATQGPRVLLPVVAFGAVLAAAWPWFSEPIGRVEMARLAATACAAAMAGAALVWAIRPPTPGTHPLDVPIAVDPTSDAEADRIRPGYVRLGNEAMLRTTDGSMIVPFPPLSIRVFPMLTFHSRSPDGLPVALLASNERDRREPRYYGGCRIGKRSCWLGFLFPEQGRATIEARARPGAVRLEAISRLDRPVYSHLNAFCDIDVVGHQRLSLAFSPCPGEPIDVRHFEAPDGAPLRFAYVEADRTFRVVEANAGEKGPFHTLALGRLLPDEPLTITVRDQGRPIARLTLDDFAAQADTTASPTAGWGVPVNAIEFSLSEQAPTSRASIFITLAGTSVGRGWDCVAHRAGTYRNRIRLTPVRQSP